MSFQTDIYPYRNDRREFPRRLLQKVDSEFTAIVSVAGHPRRNLGGRRCALRLNQGPLWQQLLGMGETREVCNYSATLADKTIAKVLLRAWLRKGPDRYLDFLAVRQFRGTWFTSVNEAYERIRQNSPRGAVKFLYNEIPRGDGSLVLFGSSLPADLTYNHYFSRMLAWDDLHCFGLVMELSRLNNVLVGGGASTVHPALQAALLWIFQNQRENPRSIYHVVAES